MSAPAIRLSEAEIRRAKAVGILACEFGIDRLPGVVYATLDHHDPRPDSWPWMPPGYALLRVWGGRPQDVWRAVQDSAPRLGVLVVLQVLPVSRWARWCAWWRVVTWPLVRWLERRGRR